MAKKVVKSNSSSARTSRKEPYNAKRLAHVVSRLREQASRLKGLAREIEKAKLDKVVVDGHAMLVRGLNQVDNFSDNLARAIREARVESQQI